MAGLHLPPMQRVSWALPSCSQSILATSSPAQASRENPAVLTSEGLFPLKVKSDHPAIPQKGC